jgi:cell division transport system permease protein
LVSPQEARRELERDAELKRYLDLLEENPLPSSARVVLQQHTPELVRAFAARAAEVGGVASVDYGDKAAETFLNVLRGLRWLSLVVGAVLCAAAGLMVSNVIRLTVFARRAEISIMQLVGASPLFVRAPYVLEGCLTGLLGGALAAGLLFGLGEAVTRHLQQNLNFDLSAYLVAGMEPRLALAMLGLGMALGFLGSLSAVGKYLR